LPGFSIVASLTSNRSAKSASTAIAISGWMGSVPWFRTLSSSKSPSPTTRRRMTDRVASVYSEPVPGTRKK
jgi:hypothetical protein